MEPLRSIFGYSAVVETGEEAPASAFVVHASNSTDVIDSFGQRCGSVADRPDLIEVEACGEEQRQTGAVESGRSAKPSVKWGQSGPRRDQPEHDRGLS